MQVEKLTRREREKIKQRSRILDTALALFSVKGYHTVSMHEIANQADCAIGTVYSHFKNKEDLYSALIIEKAEKHHQILKDVLAQKTDKLTVIKHYIAAKGEFFIDSLAIFRFYFAEATGAGFNLKAGLDNEIRWLYDDLVAELTAVLKAGIKDKVLRPMDPYYMAIALEGIINTFLYRGLEDPDQHPYAASVPLIMDIFLNGCAVPGKK